MRAQSSFLDFISGFFIFAIVLAISLNFILTDTQVSAEVDTQRVSNDLLSPGIPEDWNASNVEIAGLLSNGSVDQTKWDALDAMTTDELEDALRIEGGVRIAMLAHNGTDYENVLPTIETGAVDGDTVSTTSRIAAFNGSLVVIEVVAWR